MYVHIITHKTDARCIHSFVAWLLGWLVGCMCPSICARTYKRPHTHTKQKPYTSKHCAGAAGVTFKPVADSHNFVSKKLTAKACAASWAGVTDHPQASKAEALNGRTNAISQANPGSASFNCCTLFPTTCTGKPFC